MSISLILLLVVTLVRLAIFAFVIYAAVQGVKALRKYNRSGEVRKEKADLVLLHLRDKWWSCSNQ